MRPLNKPFPKPLILALTLIGFTGLGLATSNPVAAQELTYTLSNVTFSDGATATGFFNFNLTTQTFGNFDITTQNGVTDTLVGTQYVPNSDAAFSAFNQLWEFGTYIHPQHVILIDTPSVITAPGTYEIEVGRLQGNGFSDSGEVGPFAGQGAFDDEGDRVIVAGNLVVVPTVPEASSVIYFGLLSLGLCGRAITAKCKKKNAKNADADVCTQIKFLPLTSLSQLLSR